MTRLVTMATDLALPSDITQKLNDFILLFMKWNRSINLSGARTADQLELHVVDCLHAIPFVRAATASPQRAQELPMRGNSPPALERRLEPPHEVVASAIRRLTPDVPHATLNADVNAPSGPNTSAAPLDAGPNATPNAAPDARPGTGPDLKGPLDAGTNAAPAGAKAISDADPGDQRTGRVLDVGAGGGLPSIIVALCLPTIEVTALEPVHKKVAFLRVAARELSLSNFVVRPERIEDHATRHYDAAMSRATLDLRDWLLLGQSYVRPGGFVLGFEAVPRVDLPDGTQRHAYSLEEKSRSIVVLQRRY
jgi:16S rRNA G527 N7-methylase RsmG